MKLGIRVRLTAVFAATLVVVLTLVGLSVFLRFRGDEDRAIDAELRARSAAYFAVRDPSDRLRIDLLGLSDEHFGQVLDSAGTVIARSEQSTRRPLVAPLDSGFRSATVATTGEHRRARVFLVRRGSTTLILASALDDRDDELGHLRNLLWSGGAITLVVASGLAWFLAGAALRPVERLRTEVASYSATDLTRRLAPPPGTDEVSRLAGTLNGMLDRIQDSFEVQRSFVDRASHELRTPLANLSLELELAARHDRTQAELRAAVVSAAEESHRLDRLASNLLTLARTSDATLPIVTEPTDLGALVVEVVVSFSARARNESVTLVEVVPRGLTVAVDPMRVRQAISNLLDNAVRVTPAQGTVTVDVATTADRCVISVSDRGPGFPADVVDDAFRPFVRGSTVDRSSDGAGLGLAIVAAVAEAHGGAVTIDRSVAYGRVVMSIPYEVSNT